MEQNKYNLFGAMNFDEVHSINRIYYCAGRFDANSEEKDGLVLMISEDLDRIASKIIEDYLGKFEFSPFKKLKYNEIEDKTREIILFPTPLFGKRFHNKLLLENTHDFPYKQKEEFNDKFELATARAFSNRRFNDSISSLELD